MAFTAAPNERYTIRRQVFRIFGAGFHIYDAQGRVIGYCRQKAFRLREDMRVYTDESMGEELFRIGARQVIDFGATYDVMLPGDGDAPGSAPGSVIGSFRRRAMKSFVRDSWLVFDGEGREVGRVEEDSAGKAVFRRLLGDNAWLLPQTFHLRLTDGRQIATYRTHFNIFVHRMGVAVHDDGDASVDELMVLAGGVLLAAIEGRQG